MRIEMHFPDGMNHSISSRSPETIGRWVIEMYAEIAAGRWDQIKYPPRVTVYPSFDPYTREPDWIADTRIISQGGEPRTPQEFVDFLQHQVSEAAARDGQA
jgi:hypothetical protein